MAPVPEVGAGTHAAAAAGGCSVEATTMNGSGGDEPMDLTTPAVKGLAGVFVGKLAEKASRWIIEIAAAHSTEVQQATLLNVQNFVTRLARRVEILEEELPADQRGVFDEALTHPGTAFMLRKAVVAAGSTAVDERHEILSGLIAQRLTASETDMVALAGMAACDAILALAPIHIRLLAVLVALRALRPAKDGLVANLSGVSDAVAQEFGGDDVGRYRAVVLTYWHRTLAPSCTDDLMAADRVDFSHLAGVSAVTLRPHTVEFGHELTDALALDLGTGSRCNIEEAQAARFPWFRTLKHVWEMGAEDSFPTTIGTIIGILHHDALSGKRTPINWRSERASK